MLLDNIHDVGVKVTWCRQAEVSMVQKRVFPVPDITWLRARCP